MKYLTLKILVALGCIILMICMLSMVRDLVNAQVVVISPEHPRPRFDYIWHERHDGHVFEIWHDKETGQELICVFDMQSVPSCYLTGRKW